jgi:hypothetical protein
MTDDDQRIAAVVRDHYTEHERSQEPAIMQTADNVHIHALPAMHDVRMTLNACCLTDLRAGETAEEMRDSFVAAIEHASREAVAAWLAERSRNSTAMGV